MRSPAAARSSSSGSRRRASCTPRLAWGVFVEVTAAVGRSGEGALPGVCLILYSLYRIQESSRGQDNLG
jgi:hypothetical protein